ncbi:MAG: M55 family metallopeptidase, partial [Clostridia bacterium]|nr:M55 family metallopeptidase [Clostridia bacterium]
MKIAIMTDMEGVAGVVNAIDWIYPDSRYYETGKELLTREVNAAAEGFLAVCPKAEIVVMDGHGPGAINQLLLDPRVEYQRGWGPGPYPLALDRWYDVIAWVGQHPKAGTERGHLCHTQNFDVIDCQINGISVGEFGQCMFVAAACGVTPILACGCKAFAAEAEELVPGIETVTVKEGLMTGSGEECDFDEYRIRNASAIHKHPETSRKLIRDGAERALRRYLDSPESFRPAQIG